MIAKWLQNQEKQTDKTRMNNVLNEYTVVTFNGVSDQEVVVKSVKVQTSSPPGNLHHSLIEKPVS